MIQKLPGKNYVVQWKCEDGSFFFWLDDESLDEIGGRAGAWVVAPDLATRFELAEADSLADKQAPLHKGPVDAVLYDIAMRDRPGNQAKMQTLADGIRGLRPMFGVDGREALSKAADLAEQWEAKEGPFNTERMTLDELLELLAKWKAVASGKTCVSVENLCYGASSLWHQTHRKNFRLVDRKPEELSRWVLEYSGSVCESFPEQVLAILKQQHKAAEVARILGELRQHKGGTITICCTDPEARDQPDAMVIVEASWTEWQPRRFTGNTLVDCLRAALKVAHPSLLDMKGCLEKKT